jgi:hypothetical protein
VDHYFRKQHEQEAVEQIKNEVALKFGPGTYHVEVRTDVDVNDRTWLVVVAYFGKDKAITGTITPDQARLPRNIQILCYYLYEEAKRQRLLEFMPRPL